MLVSGIENCTTHIKSIVSDVIINTHTITCVYVTRVVIVKCNDEYNVVSVRCAQTHARFKMTYFGEQTGFTSLSEMLTYFFVYKRQKDKSMYFVWVWIIGV